MTKITTLNLRNGNGKHITKVISTLNDSGSDILVLTEFHNNKAGKTILYGLEKEGKFKYMHYKKDVISKENSVLIACKHEFQFVTLIKLKDELQHRIIKISSNDFSLLGVYIRGVGEKGKYREEKQYLFNFLTEHINDNPKDKIIITGDLNNGRPNLDHEGEEFTFPEKFVEIVDKLQYIDAWRHIHGNKKEYSWHHPASKNGFRLDHFLVHPALKDKINKCDYDHTTRRDPNKIEKGDKIEITDHSMMTLELK